MVEAACEIDDKTPTDNTKDFDRLVEHVGRYTGEYKHEELPDLDEDYYERMAGWVRRIKASCDRLVKRLDAIERARFRAARGASK